jgi:NAD(P)-dependent dehydrogenase (short-subunit alcohol dehydrogenase family)
MANPPQLDGQVAIVTGGSRGIGFAIATSLLEHGASVVASAASEASVAEALERVRHHHPEVASRFTVAVSDVRDHAQVEGLVQSAVALGRLDILVNNAGVGEFAEVADMSLESWRQVIDTNLTGVFYACRASIPHLRRGGGWIVNISSLAGQNPFGGGSAYCASKAALNAFSEALMQEVRYDDIRVSCVLPGSVRTEFAGQDPSSGAWKLAPEDVAQVVLDLLSHDRRSLVSRVEMRPSKPRR